jgi:hypothetical protein
VENWKIIPVDDEIFKTGEILEDKKMDIKIEVTKVFE